MKISDIDRQKITLDDNTMLVHLARFEQNQADKIQYIVIVKNWKNSYGEAVHYEWEVRGSIHRTTYLDNLESSNVASGYIGTQNKELDEAIEKFVDHLNS